MPVESDANGEVCAEQIKYSLFRTVADSTGSHGDEISVGTALIEWEN